MTITIDPAKDVEIEAFQTPKLDAIDYAEKCIAVARMLKNDGVNVVGLRAGFTWANVTPASIQLSEEEFRRYFKGQTVEETGGTAGMLSTSISGVRVFCYFTTLSVPKVEKKTVTL